jgi:hypothetical protein
MTDTKASEISPLAKLRALMGYVEDGSQTPVTIGQDDATMTFYLRIGRPSDPWTKVYHMGSLKGVIDQAYRDLGVPK